jgi:hypothetical protein
LKLSIGVSSKSENSNEHANHRQDKPLFLSVIPLFVSTQQAAAAASFKIQPQVNHHYKRYFFQTNLINRRINLTDTQTRELAIPMLSVFPFDSLSQVSQVIVEFFWFQEE